MWPKEGLDFWLFLSLRIIGGLDKNIEKKSFQLEYGRDLLAPVRNIGSNFNLQSVNDPFTNFQSITKQECTNLFQTSLRPICLERIKSFWIQQNGNVFCV